MQEIELSQIIKGQFKSQNKECQNNNRNDERAAA